MYSTEPSSWLRALDSLLAKTKSKCRQSTLRSLDKICSADEVAKKSDRYADGETQEIHSKYKKFTLNTRNSLNVLEIRLKY